jgi:Ca2+-binding EF-hand superfamily protein
MKPSAIKIACAALLSTTLIAWGGDGNKNPAPGDEGVPPDETRSRIFGDGILSEHLSMYDVDDNGGLSIEEYQVLKADRLSQARHQSFRSRWDLDHDGRIDANERRNALSRIRVLIEQRRLRRFAEVDANSDHYLSREEFLRINAVAQLSTPGTGEEIFRHLDRDDDRRVSEAEFLRSLDAARPLPVEVDNSKPRTILANDPNPPEALTPVDP